MEINFFHEDSNKVMEYLRENWKPHSNLLSQEFTLVLDESNRMQFELTEITLTEFLKQGKLPFSNWCRRGMRRDMVGRTAKIDLIRLEGFEEVPNGFKCHWSICAIFKLKNGVDYGKQFYRFSFVDIVEKLP